MNKTILFLVVTALFVLPGRSFALRCGNDLVQIGDLKQEALVACGEPVSKEIIGYIDKETNGERIRVLKIEEWIVLSAGYYYSLIFEGNRLISIEGAGKKK